MKIAGVTQSGSEWLPFKQNVAGSNPAAGIKLCWLIG